MGMTKEPANDTRQQRLAKKLRENLKRRKAQDRARSESAATDKTGSIARKTPDSDPR